MFKTYDDINTYKCELNTKIKINGSRLFFRLNKRPLVLSLNTTSGKQKLFIQPYL